ncbi:MAG: single-stranded DNA-binding protein [Chloroflexales bacterium]|nr:single-stranded DNA-binding protein [Chloroflexales bacterium]
MDLNRVQLTGRLGGAPRLRDVGERRVASLRLANDRRWRSSDGATHKETDWYNLTAWGSLAGICETLLHTGDRVYVEGRLRLSTYDRDGATHQGHEIVLERLILLARNGRNAGAGHEVDDLAEDDEEVEEIPY